ncbi:discoidin domain-containing protein [Cohnella sp. JJ-181]|uniref:discoidin domain-containing protein n=1 Tax=Cohnella rhizoplanae TaxID=2974897 RepID=UPI0022FF6114|nr:discoidin domain-containing protein [Cohnella sp. JJ-181]CAI6049875.1 hypothetical protein COHCIP112018_01432 [Cohnella sp. JJ-181]
MSFRSKWVRTISLASVLGLAVGLLPPPSASAATTYHVSAATGSLTGNGTTTPFKTISQCAAVMTGGDTCVIESGTYRETVTPTNTGASGSPIRFEAAAGATVIVSGTEPVSGWSVHSGNIYSANLTWDLGKENQLFVKSGSTVTPLWEARWPNISAYNLSGLSAGVAVADSGGLNTITDAALTSTGVNWTGAKIWVRGGNAYQGMTSQITSYNATSGVLNYSSITGDYAELYPKAGSTYFLSGLLGALDAPGEWFVDAAAQKVYLWAPGGGAPTNVEVKKRETAFNLNGKNYIQLAGIQTFAANITMNGSNNNVLDGVKADYVYFSNYSQNTTNADQLNGGISIVGDNNEIKNSTIAYSSGTLVNIDGNNNRVVNNYIHDGSYMASYDPLLKLSSGTGNLISRNKMENSGRYIIYWNRGIAEISYNDISNGMWLSRDGALIYAWGTDLGNSHIHHNLIHDSVHGVTTNETRVGLYFDNFTENVVAHHNVIYNNDVGIQVNTPGNYKLLYNNTVVNNPFGSIGYWGPSDSAYKDELYGTRLFNNILTDAVSLTEDVVRGFNTITSDGLNFVNAAGGNFRPSSGSTAINMGSVIPGITDGYVGPAPDAGAYEFGGTDWTAGTSVPASSSYSPAVTPYMNRVYNSAFEKNLEGWTPWTTSPSTATATEGNVNSFANSDFRKRGVGTRLKLGAAGGVEQLVTGLQPNTTYKFVAWVYTDTGGQAINVGVLNYGGSAIDVSQTTANQYVRKEVEFTTGATNTSARVRIWRAAGATGFAYADDTGLFETAAYDPGVYKNQALSKTAITASGTLANAARLTDGSTSAYASMSDTGARWVQIDLGQSYELDKINVLHYYNASDIRTYRDVIVQLSNSSTFATKTTVFNNDGNNSAGQGTGTDAEYAETAAGKNITFAKTNARYIRLWTNGNSLNGSHDYTEVQAWGVPAVTPTSPLQGRKNVAYKLSESRISQSSTVGNKFRIVDGDKSGPFANQDGPLSGPASPQWIQLDLGQKYRIDQVSVWHFIPFDRIYYDVIIQLSNDPTFPAGATTTVFNNDDNNTAGQGVGTDALYPDNATGKTVNFPVTTARYVRLWANGNQSNPSQHYAEVEVYGSPDYGMGT